MKPIKLPTKSVDQILNMLGLKRYKNTTAYASKMVSLITFLNSSSDIITGAAVISNGVSIDRDGRLVPLEKVKSNYVRELMYKVKPNQKEIDELGVRIRKYFHDLEPHRTIVRRKNTEEKKEKSRLKIVELESEQKLLRDEVTILEHDAEKIKEQERERLMATDFPIEEMRKTLELFSGSVIEVQMNTGRYSFPVPDGELYRMIAIFLGLEFMEVEKPIEILETITIDSSILPDLAKATKFVSDDDLRPAMTHVLIELSKGRVQLCATDAHRLYFSRKLKSSAKKPKELLISKKAAMALSKIKTKEATVELHILKGGDKIQVNGAVYDLLDAKFPNYKVVVPQYETFMEFEKDTFIEKVKNVSVYSNHYTNQVSLHLNGNIKFHSQDVDFSLEGSAEMNYVSKTCPDTHIAFNGKFLMEGLSIFKDKKVKMMTEGSPTKAAIFTNDVDSILLMPLMMNQ